MEIETQERKRESERNTIISSNVMKKDCKKKISDNGIKEKKEGIMSGI